MIEPVRPPMPHDRRLARSRRSSRVQGLQLKAPPTCEGCGAPAPEGPDCLYCGRENSSVAWAVRSALTGAEQKYWLSPTGWQAPPKQQPPRRRGDRAGRWAGWLVWLILLVIGGAALLRQLG